MTKKKTKLSSVLLSDKIYNNNELYNNPEALEN